MCPVKSASVSVSEAVTAIDTFAGSSSSAMVPVIDSVPIVAPDGDVNVMVKVSLSSSNSSAMISNAISAELAPLVIVIVPAGIGSSSPVPLMPV